LRFFTKFSKYFSITAIGLSLFFIPTTIQAQDLIDRVTTWFDLGLNWNAGDDIFGSASDRAMFGKTSFLDSDIPRIFRMLDQYSDVNERIILLKAAYSQQQPSFDMPIVSINDQMALEQMMADYEKLTQLQWHKCPRETYLMVMKIANYPVIPENLMQDNSFQSLGKRFRRRKNGSGKVEIEQTRIENIVYGTELIANLIREGFFGKDKSLIREARNFPIAPFDLLQKTFSKTTEHKKTSRQVINPFEVAIPAKPGVLNKDFYFLTPGYFCTPQYFWKMLWMFYNAGYYNVTAFYHDTIFKTADENVIILALNFQE